MNLKYQFYQGYYAKFDPRQNAVEKSQRAKYQERHLKEEENLRDDERTKVGNTVKLREANDRLHRFTPQTSFNQELAKQRYNPGYQALGGLTNVEPVDLQTTYPGLILGTGYNHETGTTDEITLGLYFDHTSGLPIIPGSSVKGILRSLFPRRYRTKYDKRAAATSTEFIRRSLKEYLDLPGEWTDAQIDHFENKTFAGQKDVFLDGILQTTAPNGTILGPDFLTPHGDDPLQNPVPLRMLKILPEVTLRFRFRLSDYTHEGLTVTKEQKRKLFQMLLQLSGVGAKTNVGYGRLIDPTAQADTLAWLETPLSSPQPSRPVVTEIEEDEKDKPKIIPPEEQKAVYLYTKKPVPYHKRNLFEVEGRVTTSGRINTVTVFIEAGNHRSVQVRYGAGLGQGQIVRVKILAPAKDKPVQQAQFVEHKYPQS